MATLISLDKLVLIIFCEHTFCKIIIIIYKLIHYFLIRTYNVESVQKWIYVILTSRFSLCTHLNFEIL